MCFTVKSYVERENMEFTSSRHADLLDDRQRELAALEGLLALGRSNEGTQNCPSDDDDLGGLVGSMNNLSLELTKHEKNKNSCITSNAISIDETSHIIETQCSLFSNIIVHLQQLPGQTPNGIVYIIRTIINICFAIFDYSIKLADLIDRVLIIKVPFVSIGRLLVYGYWYSLIYVTIKKYPWFGELLGNIFTVIRNILNKINDTENPLAPAYILEQIATDKDINSIANVITTTASETAEDVGYLLYTGMIDMIGKIPILLVIHQLLQLNNDNIQTINTHLDEITNQQTHIFSRIQNQANAEIQNQANAELRIQNQANAELIIEEFNKLNQQITGLDKIYTDTNLYLQGIDATIQDTSERLGLQIQDVKIAQDNILTRLKIQDTQTTTKLITDLLFAGAPQLMGLAEAMGVPLPTGLIRNHDLNALLGGKKRSTRKKCKRSKVYKRGSSKKRGICKNTKKRVKSKKSSKRGAKKTKRK